MFGFGFLVDLCQGNLKLDSVSLQVTSSEPTLEVTGCFEATGNLTLHVDASEFQTPSPITIDVLSFQCHDASNDFTGVTLT